MNKQCGQCCEYFALENLISDFRYGGESHICKECQDEYIRTEEAELYYCPICEIPHSEKSDLLVGKEPRICSDCEEPDLDPEFADDPCYRHYMAGQYDCPKCFVEQPKETVLNCLTFIIDRIMDAETNEMKINECPICMEQMTEDGYTIGENCEHKTCDGCYSEIYPSNRCCICRAILCNENEPEIEEEAEEPFEQEGPCQNCGNEAIWDEEIGERICNSCYNEDVANGIIEENHPVGFVTAIIDGRRQRVEQNDPDIEIILCEVCHTFTNLAFTFETFSLTGVDKDMIICPACEIDLQRCLGCRNSEGQWRSDYDCRYCERCYEREEDHYHNRSEY